MPKTPTSPALAAAVDADITATAVAQLLTAGQQLALAQKVEGCAPFILRHKDFLLEPISPEILPPLPDHIRQQVTLEDPESFALYVKRFQTVHTQIFATLPPPGEMVGAGFTAVFDYHQGGKAESHLAARLGHVAKYPCPLSLPWRTWLAQNGKGMKQTEFITFVDRNALEIVSPDGATLLEIATNFESRSEANFSTRINRKTGGMQLLFTEEVDHRSTAGQMTVPDSLGLRMPIFDGGKVYDIAARMEYRVADGRLYITYHLVRPQDVMRQALTDLRAEIAEATGVAILTGKPAGI